MQIAKLCMYHETVELKCQQLGSLLRNIEGCGAAKRLSICVAMVMLQSRSSPQAMLQSRPAHRKTTSSKRTARRSFSINISERYARPENYDETSDAHQDLALKAASHAPEGDRIDDIADGPLQRDARCPTCDYCPATVLCESCGRFFCEDHAFWPYQGDVAYCYDCFRFHQRVFPFWGRNAPHSQNNCLRICYDCAKAMRHA